MENNECYHDNRRPGRDKKQVIFRKQVTAAFHYNQFVCGLLFLILLNLQWRVYATNTSANHRIFKEHTPHLCRVISKSKVQLTLYMSLRHTGGVEVCLHQHLAWALGGGGWLTSRAGRNTPVLNEKDGWVGATAELDILDKT